MKVSNAHIRYDHPKVYALYGSGTVAVLVSDSETVDVAYGSGTVAVLISDSETVR
jgi:regulator of extracellular matrix RemA (YlzA/DUF370 family)